MYYCINTLCCYDAGKTRHRNDDNFYYGRTILSERAGRDQGILTEKVNTEELALYAVFDGISGEACGDLAARICAKELDSMYDDLLELELTNEDTWNYVIGRMNSRVLGANRNHSADMGTTAVILAIKGNQFVVCNVGDSRAYIVEGGRLQQLTEDHVMEIPPYLQQRGQKKGPLSQWIGVPEDEYVIEPYTVYGSIKCGNQFLLCTDGLTDVVGDGEIEEVMLSERSLTDKGTKLVKCIREKDGRDNITMILIEVLVPVI